MKRNVEFNNDLHGLINSTLDILRPPERVTVAEAAERYRQLNNPGSYVGPWQNKTTPYLKEIMETLTERQFNATVFAAPAQCGKVLVKQTPIATPNGHSTMGELKVGDIVLDENGKPCSVTATTPDQDVECYDLTFCDGTVITACEDHNWYVEEYSHGEKVGEGVKQTKNMVGDFRKGARFRYAIPVAKPLELPWADLEVDPYLLGVWLGDGYSACGAMASNADDAGHFMRMFEDLGYGESRVDYCKDRGEAVAITPEQSGILKKQLREIGVLNNKHIPPQYLRAHYWQRRALLQGLMDTDGHINSSGRAEFSTSNPALAPQFYDLLVGLGYKSTRRTKAPTYRYKGEIRNGKTSYEFGFIPYLQRSVFRLPRQWVKQHDRNAPGKRPAEVFKRRIKNIEYVGKRVGRCITVDSPNRLYLCSESNIPTHNTDMSLNWLSYGVICDPADMIMYQPSQAMSRDFSKRRIDRLHRHSPAVGERLIARKSADNTFDKLYKSGNMFTLSWPSIAELSGRPVGRVALSDYDRMPMNVDGEGSPFDLARKRTTTFGSFAMTFCESSPGFTVLDPKWTPGRAHEAPPCEGILALYNRGDMRRWVWPCVHCHQYYEPEFKLLTWPNSKDALECGEQAEMTCPHCGGTTPSTRKREVNEQGFWLKSGQRVNDMGLIEGDGLRSDIASFWLKGPAAAFASWKNLVVNQIKAQAEFESTGSEEALKSTVNTDQGEAYLPHSLGEVRVPEELAGRAETLKEKHVPHGVRGLIGCIDVQKNCFKVQIHGVGSGGDIWIIDRFDLRKSNRIDEDGDRFWVNPAAYAEDWELITEQVLDKTYPLGDDSGRHMQIRFTVCDSGGRAGVTANAYKYCKKLRLAGQQGRFMLVKGDHRAEAPRVQLRYPDSGRKDRHAGARGEVPVLFLNSNLLKDQLRAALDREDHGNGYIHFPDWLPMWFYEELCVEVKNAKGKWENPRSQRNESWDLLYYCFAVIIHMRLDFSQENCFTGWLSEWDDNPLVSEGDAPVFGVGEKKPKRKLSDLAASLG